MKFDIKSSLLAAAVAVLCSTSGAARADVVNAYGVTFGAAPSEFITESGTTAKLSGFAVMSSGNPDPRLNLGIFSYSIEPQQSLSAAAGPGGGGDSTYTTSFVVMPTLVQRLFDLGYDSALATSNGAVVFALALQELISETSGTLSLSTGSYIRDGVTTDDDTAVTDAEALLTRIQGAPDASIHKRIVAFTSASSQDFLTAISTPPPKGSCVSVGPSCAVQVPEPSGLALMAAALAAAAAVSRRRSRG